MKLLIKLFIESKNIGKAINALSEGGVSGFYIKEYAGLSPYDWQGFLLSEEPELAINFVKQLSQNTLLINTVVNMDVVPSLKEKIHERLEDEKYTMIMMPVLGMTINNPEND
ncbi:MJ1244 family protein [Methanococcus voltae]|uniref:Nitrogen regulatory protein P-II n=1 Tax=Methanococcus voltae (strain ATCC BAA-1334 / A3) TaxID=456320 RepID=D7DTX0_METV3|nr:MJ1244 family protein [Methanococcus voltae]MCS3900380.1 nitrogen regulatory protein PII-like uncharacterized protein [Methanococcus voltae]